MKIWSHIDTSITYHHHPYISFRLIEDLSVSVGMYCLAWLVGIEGFCEVHQRFAQPYISHFPIEKNIFWRVVQYLQMFLHMYKAASREVDLQFTHVLTVPSLRPSDGSYTKKFTSSDSFTLEVAIRYSHSLSREL